MTESVSVEKRGELLADHYQHTYELAHDLWKQRNGFFLWLLIVGGLALVLSLKIQGTDSLMVIVIGNLLGINDAAQMTSLLQSFPYDVVQTVLLFVVFYLLANLFNRHYTLLRHYRYLKVLENEIRANLGYPSGNYVFARESAFYELKRFPFQKGTKFVYSAVITVMVTAFVGTRAYQYFSDWPAPFTLADLAILIADVVGAGAVIYYLVAYLWIVFRRETIEDAPAVSSGPDHDQGVERS